MSTTQSSIEKDGHKQMKYLAIAMFDAFQFFTDNLTDEESKKRRTLQVKDLEHKAITASLCERRLSMEALTLPFA